MATTSRLVDMLDFSRIEFNKAISLSPKKNIVIDTKWDLIKLGEICEVIAGQSPKSENYNEQQQGFSFYQGKKDFGKIFLNVPVIWTTHLTKKSLKNDVLMSVRAPVGDVNINPYDEICIGRGLAAIRSGDLVLQKYIFEFINQNKKLFKGNQGMAFESISTNDLREIKIPIPDKATQQLIVAECEQIDNEVAASEQSINNLKLQIEKTVKNTLKIQNHSIKKLDDLMTIARGASPRPIKDYLTNDKNGINWIKIGDVKKGTKYITQTAEKITPEGAEKSRFVKEGDFILSNSMSAGRPYILKITGCVHDGWLLLSEIDKLLNQDYFYYILSHYDDVKQQLTDNALGGTVKNLNIDRVKTIKIPVPDLKSQQTLVVEIETLEQHINTAQTTLNTAAAKKQTVLKKYL